MDQDDWLRALARSAEVQAYLDSPRTGLYIARRDGHILWASPSMREVFGHDPATLVGRNAWEIFPAPEDLEEAARSSALLNEGDIAVWLHLLRADGSKAWYRLHALNREGGVILAFRQELDPRQQYFHSQALPRPDPLRHADWHDVSAVPIARPAQGALQDLVAGPEVAAFLLQPATGVYIVRQDGHILWASPSMRAVTGRGPEELVGGNGWDVFVPPEDLGEVAKFKARLTEGDGTIWMRLRMPDEGREWYRVDTRVRSDLLVCAFRREADARLRFHHAVMRARPGSR